MARKKLSSKTRRLALIAEARSGLIPESDWIQKELSARAECVAYIGHVVGLRSRLRGASEASAISEILTDLRHYCDYKNLAFEELNALACENYEDEIFDQTNELSLMAGRN